MCINIYYIYIHTYIHIYIHKHIYVTNPWTCVVARPGRHVSVSICTFVPAKQVNWGFTCVEVLHVVAAFKVLMHYALHIYLVYKI